MRRPPHRAVRPPPQELLGRVAARVADADAEVLGVDAPSRLGGDALDDGRPAAASSGVHSAGSHPSPSSPGPSQRTGDAASQPDVERLLFGLGLDGDPVQLPRLALVVDVVLGPQPAQEGEELVELPAALAGPDPHGVELDEQRRSPRTKVTRSRPPDSWSRVASCLASRTGLRPGSTMVVPIFRRRAWPAA